MSEYYFSTNIDNSRSLCIAPLTDHKIALSGQDVEDPSGYFLFENRFSDECTAVKIIARLVSEEAALELKDLLRME